eukprot:993613-Prymnesium_polylepis.1
MATVRRGVSTAVPTTAVWAPYMALRPARDWSRYCSRPELRSTFRPVSFGSLLSTARTLWLADGSLIEALEAVETHADLQSQAAAGAGARVNRRL